MSVSPSVTTAARRDPARLPTEPPIGVRSGADVAVRVAVSLVLSGFSAFCFVWSLPPTGLWPLVFVALVPVLFAQHRLLPAPLAGLAPAVTVGLLVLLLAGDALRPVPPSVYAVALFLAAVMLGLGWIDRQFQELSRYRWFVLAAPLTLVGADVLQGSSVLASTWSYPAYALYAHPTVVEPVSVFTTGALNLLILITNYALAQFVIAKASRRRALAWTVGSAAAWLAWLGAGQALLGSTHARSGAVRVAAVQAPPGFTRDSYRTLADLTRQAARRGAKLVVWHEEALLSFLGAPNAVVVAQRAAASNHVYLVVGVAAPGQNEAITLDRSGRVLGSYGKQHPVTFIGERSVPTPVPVYHTAAGPLATIICYDLDFTDTSRQAGRRGAGIVAVPSQDWGRIASIHYTHLVFRAAENHLTTIKADGGYDSAIIDPNGRILAHTTTSTPVPGLLVRNVPVGSGKSVAQSVQPWFAPGALTLGLLLYGSVLARAYTRRSRGPADRSSDA